ncbi:unnamed protein product [marine sediment metagenome]|uniref:Uncharacterized protein n=1 Tax=marine sediment metagenome TaxID=412755 RepID=X1DR87_9ZZZZ
MGDLVAAIFTNHGPIAMCPTCEATDWNIKLNGFEQRWDKITGCECANCGLTVDWVSVVREPVDWDYSI